MEEKPLYGALTVYRERAAYLRRLEQFEKSKAAYDEGFRSAPQDVRLLLGRSQVSMDAVQPELALRDVQAALQLEPANIGAWNVQARALYTMGEFEQSVVKNHRGARVRQQPRYFQDGIILGLETIQDCIGKNSGNVMTDLLPIIKRQEMKAPEEHAPQVTKRVSRIPRAEVKQKMTQVETRKHGMLSRVLAMKYLGEMANDKFFLEHLTEDPRLISANKAGSKKLLNVVTAGLDSLKERQFMLRAAHPYYTIRQAEKTESKYLTKYREEMLQQERLVGTRLADRFLKKMAHFLESRQIIKLMETAEHMRLFLNNKTNRNLPDKQLYIDRLFRLVGDGYLSLYRLSFKLSEKGNRGRIAFLLGLPTGRPSSYDSVRTKYPFNYRNKVAYFEEMIRELEICENATMRCWILYELAHLCNVQKNYTLGKFYAKGCQRQAQEINCAPWWLNACFTLISGDLRQGNVHEVENMIEEAYEWTAFLHFPDQVRFFLLKCLDMAVDIVLPDERKVIRQREHAILQVMDEASRSEARVLFKRMATVPQGRRFTVLPSAQRPAERPERRQHRQRGLSVVQGAPVPLRRPPASKLAGFQSFEV